MNILAKDLKNINFARFKAWSRRAFRTKNLSIIFAVASILSVMATYFAISNNENPLVPDSKDVLVWIVVDIVFLLSLTAVVARRIVRLVVERRKGSVGSMLQARMVLMFSMVAIVPSIVMAVFSLIFFNYGIQAWFDKKVSTAIDGSVEIARLYLEEHKKIIAADILGVARDLNRDAYNMRRDPGSFSQKLAILAGVRKLPEAIVFQKNEGRSVLLARTKLSFSLEMILEDMPIDTFNQARDGELVILTNERDDRVMALVRLENYFDSYLLVGRFVDTQIMNHIEITEGAANEYKKLESGVSNMQIKFFVIFLIVALLLLLAVVWFGFIFALALVNPVRGLIAATKRVSEGDLSARVSEGRDNDEVATLGRSFNKMAEQLERQRTELISAQRRSAWSDVARRIAHEIKNPLTPIQLATDRLKKKYASQLDNPEEFTKYVNTISRNVSSIGNMVEEFSSFARIPAPIFSHNDICSLISDVVFSRNETNSNISIDYDMPEEPVILNCDSNQMVRVMTNLIKNAEESILERMEKDKVLRHGQINVIVYVKENKCVINIVDNGKGFDRSVIDRITEPYVTTKSKGTGLGLAIVKKIIEDHSGELIFSNVEKGACVCIVFPIER
ncbi:MAG: histidine kinase [Alphaproteobacteria bacterium CG11_big_fil_rev_8_21_14_0_20_39_49]|nr:MAG: histidine kinase [Alphaproteobacteria bacterium CG11_big_fil_rev_8_21_14_0_20_39_49]